MDQCNDDVTPRCTRGGLAGVPPADTNDECAGPRAERTGFGKKELLMCQTIKKLWRDEEGLSTAEYALLLALIVIIGVTAWQALGDTGSQRVIAVDNTVASAC